MSEAVSGIIELAKNQQSINFILASTEISNVASIKVLKKTNSKKQMKQKLFIIGNLV